MAIRDPSNLDNDTEATISQINDDIQELVTVDDGGVTPKLVQEIDEDGDGEIETRREFNPNVVTRFGGTLPFDTESKQLQCGETATDQNGDENLRLNYECVCTKTEFTTLQEMRANSNEIKVVSEAYSGPAMFDQLKFDRIPDANGAVTRQAGSLDEPRYTIQLQSKQTTEDATGSA